MQNSDSTPNPLPQAEELPGARRFRLWGGHFVCYLRSPNPDGWGHDEQDVTTRCLFQISELYENKIKTGYRLIAGVHSLWLFL